MSSSIQFRFSSSKTYEAVTFSGLMIKLLELKRAIVEKRNLDKGTSDFDLRISNAQTDEVYESDDVMVPKNTSVVVRRPLHGRDWTISEAGGRCAHLDTSGASHRGPSKAAEGRDGRRAQ